MRLLRLAIAALALVAVYAGASPAQVSAPATIRARVHRAPPARGRRVVTVTRSGTERARARLADAGAEPIALELERPSGIERVSLIVYQPGMSSGGPFLECGAQGGEGAVRTSSALPPAMCSELVIRWPESRELPSRLLVTSFNHACLLDGRGSRALVTIVAEY